MVADVIRIGGYNQPPIKEFYLKDRYSMTRKENVLTELALVDSASHSDHTEAVDKKLLKQYK